MNEPSALSAQDAAVLADPPPERAAMPLQVFVFDGKGDVQFLPPGAAEPATTSKSFLLITGRSSSAEFKNWLEIQTGSHLADLMASGGLRSRCTVIEDRALVTMRVVHRGGELAEGEGQEVSIFMERGRLIIASEADIPAVLGIAQWQQAHFAPHSPADLVARLGLRAADRLEGFIEKAGDKLDDIEEQVLADVIDDAPDRLAEVRRSLIGFRRIIWPQRDMLNTLEIEDLSFFSGRDRTRLREASHRSARIGDDLQALSERAGLIHEQILDARSEQLNRSLLFLAALTAIFMPLTLVTGILGMNVSGIPYATSPYAFLVVISGLVVLGAITLAWLRHKHWI